MKELKIVLASASPRRQELLRQIGLSFAVCPSHKEERVTQTAPEQIVQELSRQKAEDIFEQVISGDSADIRINCGQSGKAACERGADNAVCVIGADTIVACDGRIMGKPKDKEDACRMLSMLQGRSHQVYTGVTVIGQMPGEPLQPAGFHSERFTFYECTEVEFFPMSREEITAYVETGEPMDKAGAYGIQGRCAAYIKGIHGDYNNVVGLPIGRLYQKLHERGML